MQQSNDMKEIFVKKQSIDDGVFYYIHFINDIAVRQIEVSDKGIVYLSEDFPVVGDAMLYDQTINTLSLFEKDFISKQEFENLWDNR